MIVCEQPYCALPLDHAGACNSAPSRVPSALEIRGVGFKSYVHARLDAAGVPADPEPEQTALHGCRIEGRLDWLLEQRRGLELELRTARVMADRCGRRDGETLSEFIKRLYDESLNDE